MKYEDCNVEIKDNIAAIGFNNDPESVKTIKNIIFMEFTVKPGDEVNLEDPLISIEAMKGTLQLKSRVSGKVLETNLEVEENPELLHEDPTKWLIKIEVTE